MTLLNITIVEVIPLISGSALLTTIITLWATRTKTKADAGLSDANSAKLLVDTATELTLQMAEQNKKTQEELTQVYNELETAKQSIVDLQARVEQRTREHTMCMEHVQLLQRRIEELSAPDKRGRTDPNTR